MLGAGALLRRCDILNLGPIPSQAPGSQPDPGPAGPGAHTYQLKSFKECVVFIPIYSFFINISIKCYFKLWYCSWFVDIKLKSWGRVDCSSVPTA